MDTELLVRTRDGGRAAKPTVHRPRKTPMFRKHHRPGVLVYRSVIRLTSAMSASVRTQPAALALAFTCAAEVAPAITVATLGRQASHDIASSSSVCPHSVANASSASTMSKFLSLRTQSRCALNIWALRSSGTAPSRAPAGGPPPPRALAGG